MKNFLFYLSIWMVLVSSGCSTGARRLKPTSLVEQEQERWAILPDYVYGDDKTSKNHEVLRTYAEDVTFPLSDENQKILQQLTDKFNHEHNCAGLAAPQIGYGKRIIIFHVPEEVKQFREDAYDRVPPTVLINPEYHPIGGHKTIDWEGCFSVKYTVGEVPRFSSIFYQGFDPSGHRVQGIARGFLARLLQHEIGHLNGELFTDLFTKKCKRGSLEEMRELRLREKNKRKLKRRKKVPPVNEEGTKTSAPELSRTTDLPTS